MERYSPCRATPFQQLACVWGAADSHAGVFEYLDGAGVGVPDASAVLAQAVNPSFPNPRRRLRLRDLAERVIDASQNEQELNKLLNEALLERESIQA